MPNTTRQEIIRYWKQADNDLDRFLENLRAIENIFQEANEQFQGRYVLFLAAITHFAQMVITIQENWRTLRHEKL